MGLRGRISTKQEAAVKAAILKTAGKGTMKNFPEVVDAMSSWDPVTRDLKFLILLQEICTNREWQLLDDLQVAEDRIRKLNRSSDREKFMLQGEL